MKIRAFVFAALTFVFAHPAFAAGRQLTGQYAPAATPALPPAEAQKKFAAPEGFEVRLFAAEPDVVNPVGMTWDERGRLWVVELYEYPLGAPRGAKPRDRVKILEDSDGDGLADKVKVFVDGLNLATGILIGNGGVYVGQAPHLLFFQDTDGDDVADKREVVMTGFGLEDRHELLNGFTWGPDGWLYMTHGVFTHSKVKDPNNPNDDGVIMTAAVARFHPRTKKFEVFAEGTSNPWGVDFDRAGNAFVTACVIDHMFHMAPGGIYVRQAGTPPHPYAYELLPSIVDHKHFRAAYAGIQIYQGNQYPEDYLGTVLMGNIHDSSVHQDRLTPNGSTFKASFIRDFVRANDGWFRPVSTQIGPDGAVWLMDWYDKYPCYQNANADPEGVDRAHGRIWRVVYTGSQRGAPVPPRPAGLNLAKLSSRELVETLKHPNVWHRRTAQRLLSERQDGAAREALLELLRDGARLEFRLAALWTLHGAQQLDEATLNACASDREPAIRTWAARLTGERAVANEETIERLRRLASDADASVRLAAATAARQFVSGSLTVNTPVPAQLANARIHRILEALILHPDSGQDPVLPFMIWMAAEPAFARAPRAPLEWLAQNGSASLPLSAQLTRKAMRRLCDAQRADYLDLAVQFLQALPNNAEPLALAALDGLIEGQKGKAVAPSHPPSALVAKLSQHPRPEIATRAQQLGALWGDATSWQRLLGKITDPKAPEKERMGAIQTARQMKNDASRDALFSVVANDKQDGIVIEAIRALTEAGGDTTGEELLKHWPRLSPAARRAAADALASRRRWALPFLSAIEQRTISVSELSAPVIRALTRSNDDYVRNRAASVIGRVRDPSTDKLKLIAEKRKAVLEGPVDLKAGHEIAKKTCLTCHKLHGEGADVGPDLTGVGRSTLDALLANIIDPNQIIGKGYENVEVETKDGRNVSGRLVEDTDTRVRLLAAGPKEEVIAKSDIASMRVSELSVMPEGLEQMPDEDFRNMIWYLLNPPQDNRPMTPELRRALIGDEKPTSSIRPERDFESIALWNPEWRVHCPEGEGAPAKLPDFAGRKNVLVTHPYGIERGAALERTLEVPPETKATLLFHVAADDQGDWELRVLANGELLQRETIDATPGHRWRTIEVDLSKYAGQKTVVRLENCANQWNSEFAYWSGLELKLAAR